MALLTGFEIENFRCFKELRVDGLTRLNLFVGTNNSGKTALLEAIEALVSEQSPFVLYRASVEREECRPGERFEGYRTVELDIRHWFHGRRLDEGVEFSIRATGEGDRAVSRTIDRVASDDPSPPFVPGGFKLTLQRPVFRSPSLASSPVVTGLPILADGFVGAGSPSKVVGFGARLKPPVGFVTTQRLGAADSSERWAGIVLTPREESVLTALRLVDPTIDRIAVSGSGDAS